MDTTWNVIFPSFYISYSIGLGDFGKIGHRFYNQILLVVFICNFIPVFWELLFFYLSNIWHLFIITCNHFYHLFTLCSKKDNFSCNRWVYISYLHFSLRSLSLIFVYQTFNSSVDPFMLQYSIFSTRISFSGTFPVQWIPVLRDNLNRWYSGYFAICLQIVSWHPVFGPKSTNLCTIHFLHFCLRSKNSSKLLLSGPNDFKRVEVSFSDYFIFFKPLKIFDSPFFHLNFYKFNVFFLPYRTSLQLPYTSFTVCLSRPNLSS